MLTLAVGAFGRVRVNGSGELRERLVELDASWAQFLVEPDQVVRAGVACRLLSLALEGDDRPTTVGP
ncbi:hypothetical protein ACIQGT_39935 [Streptomyces sp. NPDC093108]|uniref:hypothetical protein n=1 Tax=Streptomyces sp. NPDC093108 TaxID=3366030 RepID=UPI003806953E